MRQSTTDDVVPFLRDDDGRCHVVVRNATVCDAPIGRDWQEVDAAEDYEVCEDCIEGARVYQWMARGGVTFPGRGQ